MRGETLRDRDSFSVDICGIDAMLIAIKDSRLGLKAAACISIVSDSHSDAPHCTPVQYKKLSNVSREPVDDIVQYLFFIDFIQ